MSDVEPDDDEFDDGPVHRHPSPLLRLVAAVAAVALALTTVGVLIGDDDPDPRGGACRIPTPVFDSRYELSVYWWEDAAEADLDRIERSLDADEQIQHVDRISRNEAEDAYLAYSNRSGASLDGSYIAPLFLVDVRDQADLRAAVAALEAQRDVRYVQVHCAGYGEGRDGIPTTSTCAPYDLLFLLTPVVTPEELAAFEERFTTDPRVATHRYIAAEDTPDGRAPQFAVELSSDPGTGAPPPDDTEVREDIGLLHGTEFVLERPRCRPDTTERDA